MAHGLPVQMTQLNLVENQNTTPRPPANHLGDAATGSSKKLKRTVGHVLAANKWKNETEHASRLRQQYAIDYDNASFDLLPDKQRGAVFRKCGKMRRRLAPNWDKAKDQTVLVMIALDSDFGEVEGRSNLQYQFLHTPEGGQYIGSYTHNGWKSPRDLVQDFLDKELRNAENPSAGSNLKQSSNTPIDQGKDNQAVQEPRNPVAPPTKPQRAVRSGPTTQARIEANNTYNNDLPDKVTIEDGADRPSQSSIVEREEQTIHAADGNKKVRFSPLQNFSAMLAKVCNWFRKFWH